MRRRSTLRAWLVALATFAAASDFAFADIVKSAGEQKTDLKFPYQNVYVCCIGINQYDDGLYRSLSFATNDASDVARVFGDRYGYTVSTLLDVAATREAIHAAADDLAAIAQEQDAIIFFFAGHGDTVQGTYDGIAGNLIPYIIPAGTSFNAQKQSLFDEELAKLPATRPAGTTQPTEEEFQSQRRAKATDAVTKRLREKPVLDKQAVFIPDLRDTLVKSKARHVVMIFDSCFSGAAVATIRGGYVFGTNESDDLLFLWNKATLPSRTIITAGAVGQESIEHSGQSRSYRQLQNPREDDSTPRHGVFTAELLDALESDRVFTVGQLHQSLEPAVASVSRRLFGSQAMMSPMCRALSADEGEFVFVPKPRIDTWLADTQKALLADASAPKYKQFGTRSAKLAEQSKDQAKIDLLRVARAIARERLSPDEKVDHESASWKKWYDRASESALGGNADAMASMYYAHQYGFGTQKDPMAAHRWAVEATQGGSDEGAVALQDYIRMNPALVQQAEKDGRSRLDDLSDEQKMMLAGGVILASAKDPKLGKSSAFLAGVGAAFAFMDFTAESPAKTVKQLQDDLKKLDALIEQRAELKDDSRIQKQFDLIAGGVASLNKQAEAQGKQSLVRQYGPTIGMKMNRQVVDVKKDFIRRTPEQTAELVAALKESVEEIDAVISVQLYFDDLKKQKAKQK